MTTRVQHLYNKNLSFLSHNAFVVSSVRQVLRQSFAPSIVASVNLALGQSGQQTGRTPQ